MARRADPRSILITGASSGIGAALARHYARHGRHIFLHGRDEARLQQVARDCTMRGAQTMQASIDVRNRAAMAEWIQHCDQIAPLDLVIANAGISGGTGDTGETTAQAHDIFDINLTGALNTVHPALDCMAPRRTGQVALMSSLAGFSGWPGAPAYSASKAALRLYAEALNGAWTPRNIHICAICPGFIRTPLTDINPFPMPLLMNADAAAREIASKLQTGKTRVVFPWPVYLVVAGIGLLPLWLRGLILTKLPQKPRKS